MRSHEPFQPDDLRQLDDLLSRATAVVTMQEIHDGAVDYRIVGMRHDVDNFLEPAVQLASWEQERGYRSTYFILHTAPYWQDKRLLRSGLEMIAGCGHEIGFHVNAITAALEHGGDPVDLAQEAADELRSYGYPCRGVVAHGDNACYEHGFVNDEIFVESARPRYGAADRTIGGKVTLRPVSRADLGFDYDPNWISRGCYLSDSGGKWSEPFELVDGMFPSPRGQLHMLVHPCWWSEALAVEEVVAA